MGTAIVSERQLKVSRRRNKTTPCYIDRKIDGCCLFLLSAYLPMIDVVEALMMMMMVVMMAFANHLLMIAIFYCRTITM